MSGPSKARREKPIGISNPEASIWHVGVEGEAIAPPPDAIPRKDDDDDDAYNPNDDGPTTEPYEHG
jgi:hypothetical protein